MRPSLTLDHPLGLNELFVSHDPEKAQIVVESNHSLSNSDMRRVEEYLNLNMQLGQRFELRETKMEKGMFFTSWRYIEGMDCDWL